MASYLFVYNESELISLYISIAIIWTQLNGFKYPYSTWIILFSIINHSFHIEMASGMVR